MSGLLVSFECHFVVSQLKNSSLFRELQAEDQKFSLTADGGRLNKESFMVLTAHWIPEDFSSLKRACLCALHIAGQS
jgi:hypothetical protein